MLTQNELYLQMRLLERTYDCRICIIDGDHNYLFSTNFPEMDTTHTSKYCVSCRKRYGKHCRLWDDDACSMHGEGEKRAFYSICPLGVMNMVGPVCVPGMRSFNLFAGGFTPRYDLPANALVSPRQIRMPLRSALRSLNDQEFDELPVFWNMLIRELAQLFESQIQKPEEQANDAALRQAPEQIIRDYINGNFRRRISLATMAGKLGLTKSHAAVRIRKLFGKTFTQLLNERRVENAKWLLKNNVSQPVAFIARVSGFPSAPYFFRVFRTLEGMTPRDYQKREQAARQ